MQNLLKQTSGTWINNTCSCWSISTCNSHFLFLMMPFFKVWSSCDCYICSLSIVQTGLLGFISCVMLLWHFTYQKAVFNLLWPTTAALLIIVINSYSIKCFTILYWSYTYQHLPSNSFTLCFSDKACIWVRRAELWERDAQQRSRVRASVQERGCRWSVSRSACLFTLRAVPWCFSTE